MSATKHRRKATTCPNCGTALAAKMNFCPTCGQENHDLKIPLGHLLYEFVESVFHFDTKFWTTTKAIFTRPGQITKDFVEGRRARYVPPARLYIFVSFVFFLLVTVVSDRTIQSISDATTSQAGLKKVLVPELAKYTGRTDSALAGRVSYLSSRRRDAFFDSLDAHREREQTAGNPFSPADWQAFAERQAREQLGGQSREDSTLRKQLDVEKVSIGTFSGSARDAQDVRFTTTIPRGDLAKARNYTNAQLDSVLTANGEEPTWYTRAAVRQASRFFSTENGKGNVEAQSRELVHKLLKNASVMMFLLMPVVAILLLAVYYRRKRFYYEHLIFSVHVHTVVFLFFSLAFTVWLFTPFGSVLGWAALLAWVYILLALKTVYAQGWGKTALKFFVLTFSYLICFAALFFLTGLVSFLTF